jgi:hypothetical protein
MNRAEKAKRQKIIISEPGIVNNYRTTHKDRNRTCCERGAACDGPGPGIQFAPMVLQDCRCAGNTNRNWSDREKNQKRPYCKKQDLICRPFAGSLIEPVVRVRDHSIYRKRKRHGSEAVEDRHKPQQTKDEFALTEQGLPFLQIGTGN